MTPAITPELREGAGKDRPINFREPLNTPPTSGRYPATSSSASHNSSGSEAPSGSTTTCLKFASGKSFCIGICNDSPTARTVPEASQLPA